MADSATKNRKLMVQAISEYKMLQDGDRIMVCVSGGNYEGQIPKCKQNYMF